MSDAAKRCADIINFYVNTLTWEEIKHKWVAIRLSDGGYDNTLYDTKQDAVRHQPDEFRCAYVAFRNLVQGISPLEAERFLDYNRKAYDAGFRLPDPEAQSGGPDLFLSTAQHDQLVRNHARRQLYQASPELAAKLFGKS